MGKQQEEARAMSPAPTATIKIDGWWNHPERHGAIAGCAVAMTVLVYAVKAFAWAVGITPA